MIKSISGQEYLEVYEVIKKNENFLENFEKSVRSRGVLVSYRVETPI